MMHNELIAIAIAIAFPLGVMAASTNTGTGVAGGATASGTTGVTLGAGGSVAGAVGAPGPGGGTPGSIGSVGTTGSGVTGVDKSGATVGAGGSGQVRAPQGAAPAEATANGSVWRQLDRNKDGFISREEARGSAGVDRRFAQLDKDGDDRLSPEELSAGTRAPARSGAGPSGAAR